MLYVESDAISSIRIDSVYYQNNLEISLFSLGLAQNAIQYLSDTIWSYGAELSNLTLVHKRLKKMDNYDFFNPFNMIVDHPIKDLADLYKCELLMFDEFAELLKFYSVDSKVASVLMARILYPVNIFDDLETNLLKKSVSFNLKYNIEKELNKIKKIYSHLKYEYNIRPIDWLEV